MRKTVDSGKFFLVFLFLLISGCDHSSSEAKRLSKKYGISIEKAERCHSKFLEDTDEVLMWVDNNKGWFFGIFSENCDDLIEKMPRFTSFEWLLTAKRNNWKIDGPEYEVWIASKNKKEAEKEKDEKERKLKEYIKRMETGIFVRNTDFGNRWPFTVTHGYLDCIGGSKIFRSDLTEYGLNGLAVSKGYKSIDLIWKDNPEIPGTKINISEMINIACSKKSQDI
jgi:hypothetical protein